MPSCQRSVGDVNVLGLVFLIRGQFCHGGALENCASASQSLRSSLVRADRRSGCWLEISLPWPSTFSLECVLTASGFSACAAVAGDLLVGFRWQCQLYTERYPRHAQDILTVEMSARSRKGSNDFGWNSSSIPGVQLQLCTCVPLTLDVVQTAQGGIKSTSMQTMFIQNRRNIVDPINSTYLAI